MRRILAVIATLSICSVLSIGQTTWTAMNGPYYASDPRDIAIANDGTIYTVGGAGRMLVKSTDQGLTWASTSSPAQVNIYCVAVQANSQNVYVGYDDGVNQWGVRRSNDAGQSWTTVSGSLLARPNRIAIPPMNPSSIYVGLTENGSQYPLWVSTGGAFNPVSGLAPRATTVSDIVFHPTDANTFYVSGWSNSTGTTNRGLWKTTNGGTNWTTKRNNIDLGAVALDPSNAQTVFCGTNSGTFTIYKSLDGGGSWTTISFPSDVSRVLDILVYTPQPQNVLVATSNGIWKSTTGGGIGSWVQPPSTGLYDKYCQSLRMNAAVSTSIFCGASSSFFSSSDVASTWTERTTGMAKVPVVAVGKFGTFIYTLSDAGIVGLVYRSSDNGATWTRIMENTILGGGTVIEGRDLVVNQTNLIVAGCKKGNAGPVILTSTDQGSTWPKRYLPSGTGVANRVALIRNWDNPSDVSNDNRFHAVGIISGIGQDFKTTDGGSNFTPHPITSSEFKCMLIDPTNTATLFAGAVGVTLWRSTDDGTTWSSSTGNGLPPNPTINSLEFNANVSPKKLYAGTTLNGIYMSTNGGTDWTAWNFTPSSSTSITSLCLHPKNSTGLYYAGTDGGNQLLGRFAYGDIAGIDESSGIPLAIAKNRMIVDPNNYLSVYLATSEGCYMKSYPWEGLIEANTTVWQAGNDVQLGLTNALLNIVDVTLNPSKVLTINPGGRVKFINSKTQLKISGALLANASAGSITTFLPDGVFTTTLPGVSVGSSGSASFQYCDFIGAQGTYAIDNNAAATTISHCTFREGYGIRYYNVNPATRVTLASYNRCVSSTVHPYCGVSFLNCSNIAMDNSYISGYKTGLMIDNSSPGFHADTIEVNGNPAWGFNFYHNAGVYCLNMSRPYFGGFFGLEAGNNVIRDNDIEEVYCNNAAPFFGNMSAGGFNRISDSNYGVRIRSDNALGQILCENTFWGECPPRDAFFYPDRFTIFFSNSSCQLVTPPTLTVPANHATGQSTGGIVFHWNALSGTTSYRLQISTDPTFATLYTERQNIPGAATQYNINNFFPSTVYYWRMNGTGSYGLSDWTPVWDFTTAATKVSIPGSDGTPVIFALAQNFPNPFNPTTRFDYSLPADAHVTLQIFNTLGERVALVVDADQTAGFKSAEFDGTAIPSGVYYYRLQAGTFTATMKMMLVK